MNTKEEIYNLSHKQNDWLEPFQNWLKEAQNLNGIARDTDLFAKKVCAKEIFGSNLLLGEKSVRASAPKILNSFGKMGGKSVGRASRVPPSGFEKAVEFCNGVVNDIRTYFIRNIGI